MTALAAFLLLALGCWTLKVLFVAVVPGDRLPASVRQGLRHLPPAVLAAIVVAGAAGTVHGDSLPAIIASVGAVVVIGAVYRWTGRLLLAIGLACMSVALIDLVLLPGGPG